MSVLIVDLSRFGIDKGFVGLGNLDKLALRRVVAAARKCQQAANGYGGG